MHLQPDNLVHAASNAFNVKNLPPRIAEFALLRGLGYSFREIAQQLDVSPQAVSLMLSRYRQSAKALGGTAELQGLSARAVHALELHGIRTRSEGRSKGVLALINQQRNCGRKTREEIADWLGEGLAASEE